MLANSFLPSTKYLWWKSSVVTTTHGDGCLVFTVRASSSPSSSPVDVNNQQQQPSSTVLKSDNDSSTKSTPFTAGFGKLKAQRVKALVKKTTLSRKQNITKDDDQSLTQYKDEKSPDGSSVAPLDMDDFDTPSHVDQTAGATKHESPATSSVTSKGWGDGGSSVHNFETEPRTRPKQQYGKVDPNFFSRKFFGDLGVNENMVECLKQQQFIRASHIQAMAFPIVIEGKSCIIADQSGSGKTLSYLIPVVQRLRQEELQEISKSSPKSPRVVVVVPTAELASQVLNVCRSMSRSGVPFRSMVATGGFRQKTQLETLEAGVDLLIATPGRLMYLVNEGFLQLTNLRSVVLDEVDILFNDEDFEAALQSLINSAPVTTQYLFVTATLPVEIYNKLVEVFPDTEVVMGPGVHRVSPGLEEVLVDCSGHEGSEKTPETAFTNKKSSLLQLVEKMPVPKTIVFCNKIETCRRVENVLKRLDRKETRLQVLPFHTAIAQETRLQNMKDFTKSRSEKESMFLICTDRASRGIDFTEVDHVVLFDYPRDPSEYVRRVGRTARGVGANGKAFIFVVGKQVSLARRIMERNQRGHPLHDVPSAYELTN
ncbi:hypothetical protein ACFE04_010810 [Oxalis oulophora]